MHFTDISHDTKTTYRLKTGEERVFFLLNRSGDITFELLGEGARALVFAFFTGKENEKHMLNLIQKHRAPLTTSHALIKSALTGNALVEYRGTVQVEKHAHKSDASQESRGLLLSPNAFMLTQPNLEILANDVKCHHAATVSPINTDQLFYAKSRGLSEKEAKQVLLTGFFGEALEKIEMLGIDPLALRTQLVATLPQLYV